PAATRERLAGDRQELARLRAATPAPFPRALAVQDEAAADSAVHVRGNHLDAAGPPVPRGVPRLLDHALPRPAIPAGRSGRLEVARWLTDPGNPLTARVLVNRVWRLHFGAGLVRTPSNFGLRGDPPTHPELLDWLAREFVAGGWSIQDLQRAILASRAYRMDSRADGPGRTRDPDNLLLWRQNRRRLEAEMYRDALLAVAGSLDRSMGGPALELENRAYVTNDQSQDVARYSSPRRTIYLPVIRNALHDLFTTFDYNDPSVHLEQRGATAIPSQALFVLNSPLVRAQSRGFAERLLALPALDEAGRLAALFLRAYGREARAGELGAAAAYLAGARAQHGEARAWAALAQVVFASSEFLYLD
ncbi:MAG: DUF1553 domain-containing protein, partial [Planctomycetes bacterium]|nr:DUF1553 domain-containing protein [Planctomycetota bacterium]